MNILIRFPVLAASLGIFAGLACGNVWAGIFDAGGGASAAGLYQQAGSFGFVGGTQIGGSYTSETGALSVAVPAPAPITLASSTFSAAQGTAVINVVLTRPHGAVSATVAIATQNGTAQTVPPFSPALTDVDYVPLSGSAALVEFAQGETGKAVAITLIPKTALTTPNKRFSVTISNPSAGAALGAITTAEVRILATDPAKPTLTITAPMAGTSTNPTPAVSLISPYLIKGTAGDAKGIARVEVTLNGGAPVAANLGTATLPTSVPWSVPVSPAAGLNTVAVTAYDLRGNSTTVARSFNFVRRYLFSIARGAPVGVSLDSAGSVLLAATPGTAATALAPMAANSNPKTSQVLPDTPVKVTASPKAGHVFSHWTGLPGGAVAAGPVLTLTMPNSDVAGVTAHFIVNPFAGEAGAANIFYGLLQPEVGSATVNATAGFVTGTLSPSNGLFTGKVLIDGAAQSFTGYFYGDGRLLFTVGTSKQYMLTFGGRELELYFGSGVITATVTDGSNVSTGTATRGHYSATRKVPGSLLNQRVPATAAMPNKGYFTMSLPAKTQDPALPATAYPQGDGYATITLSDNGTLSLSGVLADGATMTGSSGLLTGDATPVFVQITTPGAAAAVKGSSLSGMLTFAPAAPDSDVSGADLLWYRPAVTPVASPATAAAATALYTDGWPAGIRVDAVGALYDSGLTVQTALGLPAADAVNGNALLNFSLGKLTSDITKTKFNISGNTVTKIPTTDANYALALTATSGLFSGTFAPNWSNPNTSKPAYKGILLQKGANIGGYGFFLSNAKADPDPESGRVILGAQEVDDDAAAP